MRSGLRLKPDACALRLMFEIASSLSKLKVRVGEVAYASSLRFLATQKLASRMLTPLYSFDKPLVPHSHPASTSHEDLGLVAATLPAQSGKLPMKNSFSPANDRTLTRTTGRNIDAGLVSATAGIDQTKRRWRWPRGWAAATGLATSWTRGDSHNRLVDNERLVDND